MKLITKLVFLLLSSPLLFASPLYIGTEGELMRVPYTNDSTARLLNKFGTGFNHFLGVNINNNVAVEIGYKYLTGVKKDSIKRTNFYPNLQECFNIDYEQEFTQSIKGPHISLIGSWMVNDNPQFKIFAGFGISEANVNLIKKQIYYTANGHHDTIYPLNVSQIIPRFVLGANFFVSDNIALRGSLILEETHNLYREINKELTIRGESALRKMPNLYYGIGLSYCF
jgi:hypothetical protein